MKLSGKSMRPFIGSKNYTISRNFYTDMGFEEIITSEKMSYFYMGEFGFYLQDAYVKDWVDNSMLFLEVDNLQQHLDEITSLQLDKKHKNVRVTNISYNDWGNEFFMYDPSGVLWHIGEFKK